MAGQIEFFQVPVVAGATTQVVRPAGAVGQPLVSLKVAMGYAVQCTVQDLNGVGGSMEFNIKNSTTVDGSDLTGWQAVPSSTIPANGAVTFVPPAAKSLRVKLGAGQGGIVNFLVSFQYDMAT